ncbi:MAG: tRNA pseudouridine(55) synthase TruB [Thermoanaerobaculia bacterium]
MTRDGLLLVDKATGLTSHDVVDLFRRRTRVKRVGHAGTLDPLATGLLVLCVGKVTRLQSYLMSFEKTYEGEIQFGWATDSFDAAGAPVGEETPADVGSVDFSPLVAKLTGEIEQMPPQFSAKKVGGVRAYELARRGERADLKPKRVSVRELTILAVEGSVARFRVRCSAGTYVRSIADELGKMTGTGAHLKSLRRTAVGPLTVEEAMPSDSIREAADEDLFRVPHFRGMQDIPMPLPFVMVDPMQERKLMSGQTIVTRAEEPLNRGDLVCITNTGDEIVGLAEAVDVVGERGVVSLQPRVVL